MLIFDQSTDNYTDDQKSVLILIPFKTVGLVFQVQSLFKLRILRQFKKGLVLLKTERYRYVRNNHSN